MSDHGLDDDGRFVTIVSGLPRSGTSLMMQMLEAGGCPVLADGVRGADVDNPRGYYEFEAVKHSKDDASWVAQAVGKTVKVIYFLLYDLPATHRYRLLLMHRRLDEVVASQSIMLRRRGESGAGRSDAEMVELFARQMQKLDAWLAQQGHIQHLDVDYNRLIVEPAPAVEAVVRFLGGGLDAAAMAKVVDQSLYRQRK